MKTSVVFGIALLCFIFSVVARNLGGDPHEVPSPNKISFDVNEFIKANPQIIPSTGTETPMMIIKCECAIFDTQFPAEGTAPILTHSPISVACDCESSGEENCRKLCATLAEAAKEHGPQLLCSTLGHYNNLMASVHSRICGSKRWTYTGVTAPHKICCHEHEVVACKNQEASLTQNQL